jgi:uncharacterized protein (DUF1015 family)
VNQSLPQTRLIAPFRGIRYVETDLSSLICPPYDVISQSQREELYALHPHNAVRLEFPLAESGGDCYQAAASYWREWLQQGILREEEESLYLCEASFHFQGKPRSRMGLFAGLHLESLQEGRVLPHEGTLAAAKADRLALLEAAWANSSPIWTIYDNPGLAELLKGACPGPPAARAEMLEDGSYSLWRISDSGLIARICEMIGDGPIFIADGHHRYETALAFSQKHPAADESAPINYVLTLLIEANDAGLIILPTHRAIAGLSKEGLERLWAHLRECCHLEQAGGLEGLLRQVEAEEHSFGLYTKEDGCRLFALKKASLSAGEMAAPVAILHRRILNACLGAEARFGYFKDGEEAKAAVDAGEYAAAFFLRPLRSEELIQAAKSRERLPGKSTYFWPKVPAGLVMRCLRG